MTTLFKAAKASDLIRRKSWPENLYLYYTILNGYCCIFVDDNFNGKVSTSARLMHFWLHKEDIFATDWEIYERVTKVQSSDDRETDAGHSKLCDRVLEPPSHRRQDY